jgi:hypothetical protein
VVGCDRLDGVGIPASCTHVDLSCSGIPSLDLREGERSCVDVRGCVLLRLLIIPRGGGWVLKALGCGRMCRLPLGAATNKEGDEGWTDDIRPREVRYLSACWAQVTSSASACSFQRATVFGEVCSLVRRARLPALPA